MTLRSTCATTIELHRFSTSLTTLIGVTAHAVEFLEVNKPSEPDLGMMHELKEPRRNS